MYGNSLVNPHIAGMVRHQFLAHFTWAVSTSMTWSSYI